jgi:excinuclease ABC subunit A
VNGVFLLRGKRRLGPEGGRDGGELIFEGTPQHMLEQSQGHTADFLRRYLK